MTWHPRLCGESLYHHIYAWGNDRHPVFKDPQHFQRYIQLLDRFSSDFKIDIVAYALMEWHVHLFIFDELNNISKFMKEQHGQYATYYNSRAKRVGHVFGERFHNKIIQCNVYGKWLSRYIHRQPVEAGLTKEPQDYRWTSYQRYVGMELVGFVKPQIILEQFKDPGEKNSHIGKYREFVADDVVCPVDWANTRVRLVGNAVFNAEHKKRLALHSNAFTDHADTLDTLSRDLHVEKNALIDPHGAREREIRRTAIRTLHEKYGCSISETAQIFKMSRFCVMRIVNK
jgi:REP element-mobilizing transposase RayT